MAGAATATPFGRGLGEAHGYFCDTIYSIYEIVSVLCPMRLLTITLGCGELLQFDDLSTLETYLPHEGLDFMTQVAAQSPRSFPAGGPGVCADPTIA